MALVNGTLPFMQLTEAGLPPSCAGSGARLTLMLMMTTMMIETMMMNHYHDDDHDHDVGDNDDHGY